MLRKPIKIFADIFLFVAVIGILFACFMFVLAIAERINGSAVISPLF